jgi:polar amino acid transport system permease protein
MENDEYDISRLRHAPKRHYGRFAAAAALVLLLGLLVRAFALGNIDWPVTGEFMFWPTVLRGAVLTLVLSVSAMAIGLVLGLAAAIARGSPNPVLRGAAVFYAWLFRGTPILLQLLIWYNLALVFPYFGLPGFWHVKTVEVMTPIFASLLGLGLNQGAYTSEIVRAGMVSVDTGQYEASKSIGMTYAMALRRIILPQAMRVVVPPLGNEFIGLVKTTSLASVVGTRELLRSVQDIYFDNTKVMELLFVAAAWYLAVVTVLSVGQAVLERRFGRGFAPARPR